MEQLKIYPYWNINQWDAVPVLECSNWDFSAMPSNDARIFLEPMTIEVDTVPPDLLEINSVKVAVLRKQQAHHIAAATDCERKIGELLALPNPEQAGQ